MDFLFRLILVIPSWFYAGVVSVGVAVLIGLIVYCSYQEFKPVKPKVIDKPPAPKKDPPKRVYKEYDWWTRDMYR